jgi:cellulose synthase/poly-beta-1,6-N-acetylglucosamine synthase-like glycosyltransferase
MTVMLWCLVAVVLYVYAGYPLLVILAARLRGVRPPSPAAPLPTVSCVVAAYNEASTIGGKIENLRRLDYPEEKVEIIVVSDGSTDATDDIVRAHEGTGIRLARLA